MLSFVFIQNSFAGENTKILFNQKIENKYQEKVLNSFEQKYDVETLSEEDLKILNNLIKISNKENYKLIINIIKHEDIKSLNAISDIAINSNLSKNNADKKMYEMAYTLVRKGLFTTFFDENLIKPIIKVMYNCENEIDDYKLAVYGAVYLYHKENQYDFKELLDNTNETNYKDKLDEIMLNSQCDLKRFFPECKEMTVLINNIPEVIKDSLCLKNEIKTKTLSPVKCITSPNYYVTNMLLLSTGMEGATTKGAVIGLVNPINIVSNIFLAPIYLLGRYIRL